MSQILGGVLILEDHAIDGACLSDVNIEGYLYENPNAVPAVSSGRLGDWLTESCSLYDHFRDDNY